MADINSKELKERLIAYREKMATTKTVTPKEYALVSGTLMAVFAIVSDLEKHPKTQKEN